MVEFVTVTVKFVFFQDDPSPIESDNNIELPSVKAFRRFLKKKTAMSLNYEPPAFLKKSLQL